MDLLLQAAKVLELENSDVGADRVSSKSARGTHFHQYAKSKGENSENSDGSISYSENGVGAGDEDLSSDRTSRRIGGAGTREVHNQLEKNRRKQLRECFNHLQQCVPSLENKRVATQSILQGAIKHIKNLKKKDVEQEREIQMLAKRKSELKKKYDVELNKCSEEQQRLAEALLKVKTEVREVAVEDDGHTSDSTTTASEGPCNEEDFSEEEREPVQPVKSEVKTEVSRKRKIGSRGATWGFGGRICDPSQGSQTSSTFSHNNSIKANAAISSVSSSSVALKQMLEQKKKNQNMTSLVTSDQSQLRPAIAATRAPGKAVSSLTSSYPMISTHLASAIKPAVSMAGHAIIPQTNQLIAQPSGAASINSKSTGSKTSDSAAVSHTARLMSSSSASLHASTIVSGTSKTFADGGDKIVNTTSQDRTSMYIQSSSTQALGVNSSPLPPKSPLKVPQSPSSIIVHPFSAGNAKTPEAKKLENMLVVPPKTIPAIANLDAQNLNFPVKSVIGSSTGGISVRSLTSVAHPVSTSVPSTKNLSTVIPVSLASFIRSLPVNTGISPLVTFTSAPIALSTTTTGPNTTTSIAGVAASPILTNKLQPSLGANFVLAAPTKSDTGANLILTSPVKTETGALTAMSIPANNARIATLLAAPTTHVSNTVIKPEPSVITTTLTSFQASASTTSSTYSIPETFKTVTITPTLLPLSLTGGPLVTSSSTAISHGTPLRILTPLSHNSMMATTPLTNGQTPLMPTVVQLGNTGQVALLQNLIPAQHLQVQSPHHHLLAQPFVVMTSQGANLNAATGVVTGTATTVSSSSSIL